MGLVARERTCNAITGCKKWKSTPKPYWSNVRSGEFMQPEVRIQVVNDQEQLDLYSEVPVSTARCHNRIFLTPGEKVMNLAKFDVGYTQGNSRGCTYYGLMKQGVDAGRSQVVRMSGVIAESCMSLFSEVHERDTASGKMEIQLAFYAEF